MASEKLSIKIPKLNDQNYMTWQRMAKALLVEKEHWEAMVQPTASSPAVSSTVNDKANSFLVLHVEESLLHLIDDVKPAWQNWKALQTTFASAATARKISLTRDLHGLRMSDKETIADFFGRAQQLRLQLRLVGETITDQQLTVNIMAGLPRAYDTVMEVLQDSTMPIHELQARLQLTEARLRRTQPKPPATGYGAQGAPQRGTPPGKKWCDKHKWGGHTTQECRAMGNGRKHAGGGHGHRGGQQPAHKQGCMLCNKQGHFARDCPDLKDFQKFQAEGHGCVGHMATAGHPDAAKPFNTSYDPEDWMLEEALFKELDQEYGPCTVDGCAAPDGSNNQVARYYSKAQDFLAADVRGECVWLNPPFRRAGKFINHFLENWRRAPTTTSGLILVPLDKTASWYPLVEQLPVVRSWPAGTQLFTKPTGQPGGSRRALRPCHFPVAVYFLPRRALPLPSLHHQTWPFPAAEGLQATQDDSTADHIILDSGASHYMTPERKMLKDYQEGPGNGPSSIQVANKSSIPVLGRGTLELNTWVKGKQHTVELKNVLHAPDLSLTLLSIPALLDDNAEVQFARNQCVVSFGGQPKMIAVQPRRKPGASAAPSKLFHVIAVEPSVTGSTAHVAQGSKEQEQDRVATKWHARLGHASYHTLAKLAKHVQGMDVQPSVFLKKAAGEEVCGPCMAGRQSRDSRSPSTAPHTTVPLHRIHVDLCGPMPVESIGGARYYLLATDEATSFSWLQPIRSKEYAGSALLKLLDIMAASTNGQHKVQLVRSDRGREFLNQELDTALSARGIVPEPTTAYSPESNGKVERMNRTIMERARSIMAAAGVPPKFWAAAAVHSNLLRNLTTITSSGKTPWELLHGKEPNVSPLRPFGSLVYVHVPHQLRKKLDSKTEAGMLIGQRLEAKTAVVYINHTVKEVRDFKVDETVMAWTAPCNFTEEELLAALPAAGGQDQLNEEPDLHTEDEGFHSADDQDGGEELQFATPQHAPGHHPPATTPPTAPPPHTFPPVTPHTAPPSNSSPPSTTPPPAPGPVTRSRSRTGNAQSSAPAAAPAPAPPAAPPAPPAAPPAPPTRTSGRSNAGVPPTQYNPSTGQSYAALADIIEPATVKQAMATPQWPQWEQAIQEELKALVSNGTWTMEHPPESARALPCKWVFKLKRDQHGEVERFKARLVAGGHRQVEGIDYNEIYAPVGRHATLKCMLSVVAARDLELHAVDISNAFLNGELHETIYMKPPEMSGMGGDGKVCKLMKTLYGLKQSPKEWFNTLSKALTEFGMQPSAHDPGLWYGHLHGSDVYIVLWVDDIIIGALKHAVDLFKKQLLTRFKGRDLGEATHYLNMSIVRDRTARTITLTQPQHIASTLDTAGMSACKGSAVPMHPGADMTYTTDSDEALHGQPYAACVGALLYISNCTRPDIALAVSSLARHMSNPCVRHWEQCLQLMRYLQHTKHTGITLGGSTDGLVGYSDADFAGCKDTRKSRSGYVFLVNGGAVSWSSKLQNSVALSTAESEYMAASAAAKEAIWLKRVCQDLGMPAKPVVLHVDNQAAQYMATSGALSARTKHIAVRHHFLRDEIAKGNVVVQYVQSKHNLADVFTKPLLGMEVSRLSSMFGVK